MATRSVKRSKPLTRADLARDALAWMAKYSFRATFNQLFTTAALLNPRGDVSATVAECLRAMGEQVRLHEALEARRVARG